MSSASPCVGKRSGKHLHQQKLLYKLVMMMGTVWRLPRRGKHLVLSGAGRRGKQRLPLPAL